MNIIDFSKYFMLLKKSRTIMMIALVLCISGAANAQDVVNDAKANDEAKKTTITTSAIKKTPVVQSKNTGAGVALVSALTQDKDRRVRRNAAKSLEKMNVKNAKAIKGLIRQLNDADPAVRKAATDALKKIGSPAIQPLTVVLKKHRNPVVRRQAATLIGEISRANLDVRRTLKRVSKRALHDNVYGTVAKVNKKPSDNLN